MERRSGRDRRKRPERDRRNPNRALGQYAFVRTGLDRRRGERRESDRHLYSASPDIMTFDSLKADVVRLREENERLRTIISELARQET